MSQEQIQGLEAFTDSWGHRLLDPAEPLGKAWSPEARAAAAAARRANGGPGGGDPQTQATAVHPGPDPNSPHPSKIVVPGHPSIGAVNITEDAPTSTKVEKTAEIDRSHRMKGVPEAAEMRLSTADRPIDYGEVNQLLKEKYGEQRGDQMYQDAIDKPGFEGGGRHFVVGAGIVKEKKAMMRALGKTGDHRAHHYQGLYKKYHESKKP